MRLLLQIERLCRHKVVFLSVSLLLGPGLLGEELGFGLFLARALFGAGGSFVFAGGTLERETGNVRDLREFDSKAFCVVPFIAGVAADHVESFGLPTNTVQLVGIGEGDVASSNQGGVDGTGFADQGLFWLFRLVGKRFFGLFLAQNALASFCLRLRRLGGCCGSLSDCGHGLARPDALVDEVGLQRFCG